MGGGGWGGWGEGWSLMEECHDLRGYDRGRCLVFVFVFFVI